MVNIKNITGTDLNRWKKSGVLVLFCFLYGCALFPPQPAECTGQFRPVNAPAEKDTTSSQPTVDSNAINETGELGKTQHSAEGAVDGK